MGKLKITRPSEVEPQESSGALFTDTVSRQGLAPGSEDFNVNNIIFGKGVRNKFHTHESDQILIANSGTGVVATENERVVVEAGDVILIPAGEKHWHGATEDSDFSHIAITRVGSQTTQLEE